MGLMVICNGEIGMSWHHTEFRDTLKRDYSDGIKKLQTSVDPANCLKIDLHCHDKNSDVPDELWGRILGIPETWLKTSSLLKVLKNNGATAYTISNHNNARSCWKLKEKGVDILSGAEFTCRFKEFDAYVHVLAYGFTPEQEASMNQHRKDIYRFCRYTLENNIPTVLPHPTYLYFKHQRVGIEILEKLSLLFERFEVLNGQRDIWQNQLTLRWLQGMNPEKLRDLEKKHGLLSSDFCVNPNRKIFTGGTDDHMGIFAGNCGTMVQVDNLAVRAESEPISELALEGLREGKLAPYGYLGDVNEKLNIAFVDYFCQVTLNMKDPGLMRVLLHKGDLRSKLFCLGIANGIFELRRHKHTMAFLKTLHKAMRGKKPNALKKLFISKTYLPFFEGAVDVSKSVKRGPQQHILSLRNFVERTYVDLNRIVIDRVQGRLKGKETKNLLLTLGSDWEDIMNRLEIPASFRSLFAGEDLGGERMSSLSLGGLFDRLSFPLLGSMVLAASTFTSTRVMFNSRSLLNDLAESIQECEHPKRVLWLTDSLYDHNGVSMFLKQALEVVREYDLPIDFLTCGPNPKSEDHLHIVEALTSFKVASYGDQPLRVPNLMSLQKIFYEGAYDRVICSTEIMGWMALYLKTAFSVPAHFYMHTDWMDFFKRSIHMEEASLNRCRRFLRFFYQRFDGVFTLNKDHQKWLTGKDMGLKKENVKMTRHWTSPIFSSLPSLDNSVSIEENATEHDRNEKKLRLLYVGRLSEEKGIYDLLPLIEGLSKKGIESELTIVGEGVSESVLKQSLPDALFTGWIEQKDLLGHYQKADLLVLPSRFDTFGCVVLESLQCGCPVLAYDCKGPKEILSHEVNGFLSEDVEGMIQNAASLHGMNPDRRESIRSNAILRAKDFGKQEVMSQLLLDLGMEIPESLKVG